MEWIRIADEPPGEDYAHVLTCNLKGKVGIGAYRVGKTWFNNPGRYEFQITHWMPLPPLPKE